MPLTPRTIVLAARSGLALAAAGAFLVGNAEGFEPSPAVLIGSGWSVGMLALLGFPRVRKNDLLMLIGVCGTVSGCLATPGTLEVRMLGALAGALGPLALAATLGMMRIRYLAAANAHMPFSEWQQLDRRRRRTDAPAPAPAIPAKTVTIEAERNC